MKDRVAEFASSRSDLACQSHASGNEIGNCAIHAKQLLIYNWSSELAFSSEELALHMNLYIIE